MKSTSESQIGDTFHHLSAPVEALPGFRPAKPMLFAGLYPIDPSELPKLQESVDRLMLTDASVGIQKETSVALGQGFRLGFLGECSSGWPANLMTEADPASSLLQARFTWTFSGNDSRRSMLRKPF